MHSSRPSIPPRPRRVDNGRRAEPKPTTARREDKNVSVVSSSPRRVTRGAPEPSRLKGVSSRSTVTQPKLVRQQKNGPTAQPVPSNSKPKVVRAAPNLGPAVVDPNCNEPGLPCLCCDGHSVQDSNSLFNHNHNNNNTVAIRQQLKLPSPPQKDKEPEKKPEIAKNTKSKPEEKQQPVVIPVASQIEDEEEENGNEDEKGEADPKDDDAGVDVNPKVDENGNDNVVAADVVVADVVVNEDVEDEDDDDEDDNTLVPSCCDCPASMLDFSLTSSTSSSSTSISSCSDLESDCPDSFSMSLQEQELYPAPHSPASSDFQPSSLPLDLSNSPRPPPSPCSPDEGYPSAPLSPSSDFMDSKGPEEEKGIKVDLLNFLDSIDELGKVDRFYRIVQVAQWELEGDLDLRDRLVHQERLEKVNKQVKLVYLERLQNGGLDFDEEDLSGVLDEMGNIDISWNMFKSDKSCDSQEYSDAGVDMTAPSDLDEPPAPDSLAASPVAPPPRPPKPPARYISGQPELHTYMNISGNTPSVSSASSPVKSFSLSGSASPSSASASKPPALPPPPSQPVPYFSLYSDSPTLPSPTPPIPPPRRRHKARLEAQRLAELEKEKTPKSLPAPTSRPPPLPPPPVTQPSPPAIPPPPSLPPPPSFHALDVEIRKLLALAGITQAELLRLSPELGVCVDGILEEGEISEISKTEEEREGVVKESDCTWSAELREENEFGKDSFKDVQELHTVSEEEVSLDEKKEESKDTFRTTSFTEMARRRKRNGGSSNSNCSCDLRDNTSLTADSYYSTDISNKQRSNASFGDFDYASVIPDSPPPPPPPRPLPPRPQILSNPPELPPLKPCTLLANASRPDRFDWLIAFTPDTEAPPLDMKKKTSDAVPQKTSSGLKVTTFKELRNRGKQASPPAQVQPEPEPVVITPDPDFLYNLKWRREKADGDGSQWEYTSQAQATFLQPPPTPASLALFREMRHINIQGNASVEPRIMQRNEYSAIKCDSSDLGAGQKEQVLDETEVRGMADGGRTWETKTKASSPLSVALPHPLPSPYYLHPSPPPQPPLFYRSDFYRSQSKALPFPQVPRIPSDSIRDVFPDSLYCTDSQSNGDFTCHHKNPSSNSGSIIDSLYQYSRYCDNKKDQICSSENDSFHTSIFSSVDANCFDSNSNVDSLFCGDKYRMKSLTFAEFDKTDINTCAEGNTTPYKNIDMINYINAGKLNDLSDVSENASSWFDPGYVKASVSASFDLNGNGKKMENKTEISPFPTLYLYHPKNCPMHKGAPPRLSPIGAISPPLRGGSLSPGADVSRLSSPLFPRSHTLPALAAPLYYPYLYTPRAQAPLPEPSLHSQQRPSTPLSLTVRSLSFAGSAAKGVWMGSDVRTPLRGDGLSSLCLQEKRALVSAVSVAVEAILAQFSSSRTLVQKALSGDSSVNPTLGRLVVQCLCPALRDLLSDGLKPHQSDLIAGRRPNSPWSLVQASTKTGPTTQALYSLQVKVAALPQLKHNRHRFNSFLIGLLNIKRLDFWLSHLHSCSDVLETFYRPTAFIRLSATSCQPLFEELLLLLQPLSLLTFNLDLLFQHHHLDPASPDLSVPRPPKRGFSFHLLPTSQSDSNVGHIKSISKQDLSVLSGLKASGHHSSPTNSFSPGPVQVQCRPVSANSKGETSPQLQWLKEKEIEAPPSDGNGNTFTQQAGQALQEGWGAVMRWGERLGQNLGGLSSTGSSEKPEAEGVNIHSIPDTQKSPGQEVMLADAVPWGLGRLFGASKSPNNPPTKRRPSQWFSPGITVLSRMTSAGHAFLPEKIEPVRKAEKGKDMNEEEEERRDKPKPLRAVRTLCDHTGTGAELSFRKGEELVVLGGVDQDWIRCRQGDKEGLVPIGYASLIM